MQNLRPIPDVAAELGLSPSDLLPFGHDKAKVPLSIRDRPRHSDKPARLVLVSAITPTPAGEGKTTSSIGIGQAMRRLGQRVCLALREPSLGPVFGVKGGGTGGGRSLLEPMADINLHFTGDLHAISSAHNLLSAMVDNHLHFGLEPQLHPDRIKWPRVMDMNDRALRKIIIGLQGSQNGVTREAGFDITAASELMAILSLAEEPCNGVDDDCDGEVDRFRVPTDYRSVQEAVDALSDRQEICLEPGVHTDSINVSNRTFTLTAWAGPELTTIDLAGTETPFMTAEGAFSDLTLRGVTVTGFDDGALDGQDLEGGFLFLRRGRVRLEDVHFRGNTVSMTDDDSDVRGGLVHVTGGTLELDGVTVEDLSLRYVAGNSAGSPDLDGGFVFVEDGVLDARDLVVSGLRLSTVHGMSDCVTDGGVLHTEDTEVILEDFVVSDVRMVQDCAVSAYVRGAVAWFNAGSLDLSGVSFTDVEVSTTGGLAYVNGLVRAFGVTGTMAEVHLSDTRLEAVSDDNAYVTGGLTIFGSKGVRVSDYQAWGNEVVASDLDGSAEDGVVQGGVLYGSGELDLVRLDLRDNSAQGDLLVQGGAAWLDAFGAQLTVSNLVAAGNEAGLSATATVCGGGLYVNAGAGAVSLAQLDLVGNEVRGAEVAGGGLCVATSEGAGTVEVVNSSVVGSVLAGVDSAAGAGVWVDEADAVGLSWRFSDVFGNTGALAFAGLEDPTGTGGNLAVDPAYVDRSSPDAVDWDLRLRPGSPLVDAGDPDRLDADGSVSDVGATGGIQGG